MGEVADAAGIQFRLLNRRKGPAVRGPRTQADRKLYRQVMQAVLAEFPTLDIRAGAVEDILLSDANQIAGVILADGTELKAPKLVLTTGTFLRGLIHIGDTRIPAGRVGDEASMK